VSSTTLIPSRNMLMSNDYNQPGEECEVNHRPEN